MKTSIVKATISQEEFQYKGNFQIRLKTALRCQINAEASMLQRRLSGTWFVISSSGLVKTPLNFITNLPSII